MKRIIISKQEALDFRAVHLGCRMNSSLWSGSDAHWVECNFYHFSATLGKEVTILRCKVICDSENDAVDFLEEIRGISP